MAARSALIVDDSKSARFALRRYLESQDFAVETAESAEQALDMLRDSRPAVIFLDYIMPGLSGFEALQRMKSDPAIGSIPVVICSSDEGAEFNRQAIAWGALDVLQKPPSPDQLSRILNNLRNFSQTMRADSPTSAPTPTASPEQPPVNPKVSNIRTPEVTIEQAVLKALRTAIPPQQPAAPTQQPAASASQTPPPKPQEPMLRTASPAAPTPPAGPASQAATPGNAGAAEAPRFSLAQALDARFEAFRGELDAQINAVRHSVQALDGKLGQLPAGGGASAQLEKTTAELRSTVGELSQRMEGIEQNVYARIADLQVQTESVVAAQIEQMRDEIMSQVRAVAADEAQAIAERTIMSSAARISDQLAASILNAIGR